MIRHILNSSGGIVKKTESLSATSVPFMIDARLEEASMRKKPCYQVRGHENYLGNFVDKALNPTYNSITSRFLFVRVRSIVVPFLHVHHQETITYAELSGKVYIQYKEAIWQRRSELDKNRDG